MVKKFLAIPIVIIACCSCNRINPDIVDNIALIQVTHPYLGHRLDSIKLDDKLIPDFLNDFADKKEEITKFYSCYVIKIHLKDGSLISYRTNGHEFEKFKDDNTKAFFFRLNKNINLVTKYWGIPEDKFCDRQNFDTVRNSSKVASNATFINNDEPSGRICFKSVAEIVNDKKSNAWVKRKNKTVSLALHFNLSLRDSIDLEYSSECWLIYPFKIDENRIVVYWDTLIDSKYNFDIVRAIDKIDKKYVGKPFMILNLVNDTTLKATYPMPELIKKINSSSIERVFFPDKYIVSQEFYL